MNIFDILGPVMVGPSSSHTAGATRIGYIASKLLKDELVMAQIYLHGSFATTGLGHGTDRALVAGLLGMKPDDMRIPDSLRMAKEAGIQVSFQSKTLKDAHPNTALLKLEGKSGRKIEVQAASVGGGRILIHKLDGVTVDFTSERPVLIVHNMDQPGHIARVTSLLAQHRVNIATMQVHRDKRGSYAVMVVETDQPIPQDAICWLSQVPGVLKVTYYNSEEE